MQTWEDWISVNKNKMEHPVNFEEKFVIQILTKIDSLCPEDVIPQYHFTDFDGGNRYIDFCIKNEEKGYFLSIELDGRFKFQHDLLEKTLERQNALVAKVGTLVRYANTTWLNNPNRVINEIQTILFNQNRKYMNDKNYRKQIENSLEEYQKQLKEVRELSKLNNHDKELRQLNSVIISLQSQLKEKNETQQNSETTEELKNINRMMLGLSQQFDDLKQKLKEDINTANSEKNINITSEYAVESKTTGIKHIHMFLLGLIIIFITGTTAYFLKDKVKFKDYPNDTKDGESQIVESESVFNTIPEPSSNEPKNIRSTDNGLSQIELKQVSTQAQHQYADTKNEKSLEIQASNAANYIGEYKRVCGEVVQIKDFSKGTYLNFGDNYPKQDLTVVVWSNDMSNFGDLNQYVGNRICISGKISSYKGTPQIELSNLEQLN